MNLQYSLQHRTTRLNSSYSGASLRIFKTRNAGGIVFFLPPAFLNLAPIIRCLQVRRFYNNDHTCSVSGPPAQTLLRNPKGRTRFFVRVKLFFSFIHRISNRERHLWSKTIKVSLSGFPFSCGISTAKKSPSISAG